MLHFQVLRMRLAAWLVGVLQESTCSDDKAVFAAEVIQCQEHEPRVTENAERPLLVFSTILIP